MHLRRRRTRVVLASLLAALPSVLVVSSCSSPDTKLSSPTGSPAATTSSPSASTTSDSPPPTTSSSTPSATSPTSPRPTPVPAPKPKRVNVTTTFAGWNTTSAAVEVGGYATVVEAAGTCTLRLIQGAKVVTREHAATADATTVACGGFSVPRTELAAGQWQAVLAYTSSKSTGKAAAVAIKVP